jgi:AcrR family transcriptional regulator
MAMRSRLMHNEKTTREKILDAAEKLFSENGFSATSVRAITTHAEVNLASLNYHFGSKEALIDAVLSRRIRPINQERIRLLDRSEERGEPLLEEILDAFLRPALHLAYEPHRGGRQFMQLMGRVHSESRDFFDRVLIPQFKEVLLRFEAAFQRVLPNLPGDELFWRVHFTVGAMAHTMAHSFSPRTLEAMKAAGSRTAASVTGDKAKSQDAEAVLAKLILYSAAGFRAEVAHVEEGAKK